MSIAFSLAIGNVFWQPLGVMLRNSASDLAQKKTVTAGLIGAGYFGTGLLAQSMRVPGLQINVVADCSIEAAQKAFAQAGFPPQEIAICHNRQEALHALEMKKRVIVEDPMLLMDLPLDVIAESTGIAEAAARHAQEAIRNGKHVAMISKEPDSVVGPILKYLADRAGVVYTPVDGDQHGLAIGLVSWIRGLGLEVICAGKSRDVEFIFNPDDSSVAPNWDGNDPNLTRRVVLDLKELVASPVLDRGRMLAALGSAATFDYCEIVIAANATGLSPDIPKLHQPIVRMREIPEVLCPKDEGGILERRGIVDLITCLRRLDEPGLGGGVFAVVSCDNDFSRRTLIDKGLIANRRGTAALIYRPYHLCGVETPKTLLDAGLLGVSVLTAGEYRPRFDMVLTTARDLKAGDLLDSHPVQYFEAAIIPAIPWKGSGPMPAYMGAGKKLRRDVPARTLITQEMVEMPANSILLSLREQQDRHFGY